MTEFAQNAQTFAQPARPADFADFVGSEITFKPIAGWPGPMTQDRRASIFGHKTTVGSTIALLRHELRQINAGEPVIAMALKESQIRRDGYPKSDARPEHPGVILSFDKKGPKGTSSRLVYKCDTFNHWHWNVRAIALTLEALRKPDRYGVLTAGEQYAGNRMLTAGGTTTTIGVEAAARYVAKHATNGSTKTEAEIMADLLRHGNNLSLYFRLAAVRLHPDRGGTTEQMDIQTKAKQTLLAHHGMAS
jgi:hypothetical protein